MATVTKKKCDVFGSLVNVMTFEVRTFQICDDGKEVNIDTQRVDLCPRAQTRLGKFIARATTPPTKKDDDNGDTAATS